MATTSKIEIVDSKSGHIQELCDTIREKDRKEAEVLGLTPYKGIFYSYRNARLRKTCLIDDKVVAMWGVCGDLLSNLGHPYLITGEGVNKVSPLVFVRIYKRELEDLKTVFPVLENYVDVDYKESIRLLKLMGFTVTKTSDPRLLKFCLTS